jgi:GNAT superfamily N-acetyltransferase
VTVEIHEIGRLPPRLVPGFAALAWSDNDAPFDPSKLRKARALGHPYTDYLGLLAVEDGAVLSQILVDRLRLTTRAGVETFSGISGVVTRPDALHRGLCSRLFEEVHRRETEAGVRLSLLWTHRSWAAHRLYEKLGYRDVYSHPVALRRIRRANRPELPSGYATRRAVRQDAALLESLLAESTAGRRGFVPRYPGAFAVGFAVRWRSPRDHQILLEGSRPVGYFFGTEDGNHVAVFEGVATSEEHRRPLLDAMERRAAGRWLTFGRTTFVHDAAPLLRERGYSIVPSSHATLMARALTGPGEDLVAALPGDCQDPTFSCHRGDMF